MFVRRNLLVPLFACALAVLTSRPCHAGPDALTDKAAALYDEGMAAYGNNKMPQAHAAFLAAWALKHHWQIAASLGDSELQLGLFRDAAEHFAYFFRHAPAERRTAAGQRLYDTARAKVGSLTVTVDLPGADVAVDGNVIGKAPLEEPLFVEPGHHQIEARSGTKVASAQVDVPAGASQTVPLALTRPDPVLPVVERRPLWPALAAGGVAIVALGVGTGLTVAANGKASDLHTLQGSLQQGGSTYPCTGATGATASSCSTLHGAANSAQAMSDAAFTSFVIGGALALASGGLGAWTALGPKDSVPKQGVVVRPMVGVGQAGVVAVGRW
jgi:hypothetical protein